METNAVKIRIPEAAATVVASALVRILQRKIKDRKEVTMDISTQYSRSRGSCPDWAWHQLNDNIAQENYAEQRTAMIAWLNSLNDEEETVIKGSSV